MVPPAALPTLERLCRLHAVVLRSRTGRGEQADHVTGGTCVPDDDGRAADGADRHRGGRRGASCQRRDDGHLPRYGPGQARRADTGARAWGTAVTLAEDAKDDERTGRSLGPRSSDRKMYG